MNNLYIKKISRLLYLFLLIIVHLLWQVSPLSAQTVPCNSATSASTNISGLCIGCYVDNPALAVDTNTVTFSTLRVTLGLLGGYVEQRLNFPTISQPGDSARIFLSFPVGLLDLSVLGSIQVATYNGITYNNDRQNINGGLLNIRLLAADQALVSWAPTQLFNSVEIRLNAGLLQLLSTVNIGYAHKVVPAPVVIAASNKVCSGDIVQLSATAPAESTIRWFAQPLGGMPLATGINFPVKVLPGNNLYYAQAERNGCVNPQRTVAAITGTLLPAAPQVRQAKVSICRNDAAYLATIPKPGMLYRWYNQPIGGTLLSSDTSYFTPALNTATQYYVGAIDSSGCMSVNRTLVEVAMLPPGTGIAMESRQSMGGSGEDKLLTLINTFDSSFLAGGITTSTDGAVNAPNRGMMDWWLVKLDRNRNKVWSKTFGTTGYDSLTAITITRDGRLIVAGNYNTRAVPVNGQLLGLDSTGREVWNAKTGLENTYLGPSWNANASIAIGSNGNAIKLTELSSNGNTLRTATYTGSYSSRQISFVLTADKGMLIAGSSDSIGIYGRDLFLLKIDSNLHKVWEKVYLAEGDDVQVKITNKGRRKFDVCFINIPPSITDTIRPKWMRLDADANLIFLKSFNLTSFAHARSVALNSKNMAVSYSGMSMGGVRHVADIRADDMSGEGRSAISFQYPQSNARRTFGGQNNIGVGRTNDINTPGPTGTGIREMITTAVCVLVRLDSLGNIVALEPQQEFMLPTSSAVTSDGGDFITGTVPVLNADAQLAKTAPPSCLPATPPLLSVTDETSRAGFSEMKVADIKDPDMAPLFQVSPNPFSNTLTCRYQIAQRGRMQLLLIPVNGKIPYVIKSEIVEPGVYTLQLDTQRYSSGTYILQLQQGGRKQVLKLIKF